jgi:hypothetical protein
MWSGESCLAHYLTISDAFLGHKKTPHQMMVGSFVFYECNNFRFARKILDLEMPN